MGNERKKTLLDALKIYGAEKQTDMAIEEMGELIVAINHNKRGRVDMCAVQEEIADVKIVLDQLSILYGEKGVSKFEKVKMNRLKERILKHL